MHCRMSTDQGRHRACVRSDAKWAEAAHSNRSIARRAPNCHKPSGTIGGYGHSSIKKSELWEYRARSPLFDHRPLFEGPSPGPLKKCSVLTGLKKSKVTAAKLAMKKLMCCAKYDSPMVLCQIRFALNFTIGKSDPLFCKAIWPQAIYSASRLEKQRDHGIFAQFPSDIGDGDVD